MDLKQNNNFHLIRLLAACQVIYNHTNYWLHLSTWPYLNYIIGLFPGVAVFFVISGFLVTKSYVESPNLKTYAYSRIFRIYPALWVNLSLILLLLYLTGSISRGDILSYGFLSRIFTLYTAGSDCPPSLCGSIPFNFHAFYKLFPSGVLWTITVELGFYLLVPLIFYYLNRQKRKWIFILTLSFIFSFLVAKINTYFILIKAHNFVTILVAVTIFAYLWIFLLGALIYIHWKSLAKVIVNQFWKWLALYLILSFLALAIHHDHVLDFKIINFFNVVRILSLAFVIISFAYSVKSLNFFPGKIDISYGMYLFHMQIVYSLMFAGFLHSAYLWLVVYASTAIIASASWYLIEKPCLKWKSHLRSLNQLRTPTELSTPLLREVEK